LNIREYSRSEMEIELYVELGFNEEEEEGIDDDGFDGDI